MNWYGHLPNGWQTRKIRELFSERNEKVSDKDYPPLSVSKHGTIPQIANVAKTINGDSRKLVRIGDYAINSRSDRKGSSGLSQHDGSISLINIVLTPRNEILGRFAHYILRSHYFIEEFYRNGRGIVSDLWTTRYSEMRTIIIPLPPLEEQARIVRWLDWQNSCIARYIRAKKREIECFKELKKTIISRVVTKGLQNGIPMKDVEVKWLDNVPKHWGVVKFKRLFGERVDKGHPQEPMLVASKYSGVIPKGMYENRTVMVSKNFHDLKLVKVGDFVISLRSFQSGIEYAYYQGIISTAYTILIPQSGISSNYFKYLAKSSRFIELLTLCVTGIREGQNIDYSVLKNNLIPLPPLPEQEAIAAYLNEQCTSIDTMISKLTQEINLLAEYRVRIVSDAVTGKFDLRSVDIPDFESESEIDEIADTSELEEENGGYADG